MKKILNIATDYPDGFEDNYTLAVKNLLDKTNDSFEHSVVSIFRSKKHRGIKIDKESSFVDFVIKTPRLPAGLFCSTIMTVSAIIFYLKHRDYLKQFNVFHAHKLTIDGVFGYVLSLLTGTPLVVSIRGTTDYKFAKKRLHARWIYKKILDRSRWVFFVSAWCKRYFTDCYHFDSKKSSLLANLTNCKPCLYENDLNSNGFVFIGRLDLAEDKGLYDLLEIWRDKRDFTLDIYGTGSDAAVTKLDNYIKANNISERVHLRGKQNINSILANRYVALLVPSYPETFGMVYVEALLANTPVLMCKDTAIDGYLEGKEYLSTVKKGDLAGISNSIDKFYAEQLAIKSTLSKDMKNNELAMFDDAAIVAAYANVVSQI